MQDLSTKEKTLLPITIETKFVTIFGATPVNTYINVCITFIDRYCIRVVERSKACVGGAHPLLSPREQRFGTEILLNTENLLYISLGFIIFTFVDIFFYLVNCCNLIV